MHENKGGCMARLRDGLYGVYVESSVIILTLISALAVTGELLICLEVIQVPPGSKKDETSTNNNNIRTTTKENKTDTNIPVDPGGDDSSSLKIASDVFHYTSLVIASLFIIEIFFKILARGKSFFKKIWLVVDALIVLGTFTLEVVFTVTDRGLPLLEAATYVVIFRLWRIPYVCNIKARAQQAKMKEEIQNWQSDRAKYEEKCSVLQMKVDKQQNELRGLEKKLEMYIKKQEIEVSLAIEKNNVERSDPVPICNGHVSQEMYDRFAETAVNKIIESAKQEFVAQQLQTAGKFQENGLPKAKTENAAVPVPSEHVTVNVTDIVSDKQSPLLARRPYLRTKSESSASLETSKQEVVVQVERELMDLPNITNNGDMSQLICNQEMANPEDYSYHNTSFEDDIVVHRNLQVLSDIDGTKTYRSADGIPMTSL